MNANLAPFTSPAVVQTYVQDAPKKVPGLADLHRMTTILLGEGAPASADVLVVGAGGGLEIGAMAKARALWRFTGVDPSASMLDIARQTTAFCADRVELLEGTVDQAPDRLFDGATCLLTLHFLSRSERLHTLKEVRRRLKPRAVFVIAHHTAVNGDPERWLARSASFVDDAAPSAPSSVAAAKMMAERLPLLAPFEEEELLREAGFKAPELFYAAFSFRGWAAVAG